MARLWRAKAGWSTCKLYIFACATPVVDQSNSYGMVLAKEKNEELALYWLVRSVHLFPMNWGCWLEMTSLITRVEDVSYEQTILSGLLIKKSS